MAARGTEEGSDRGPGLTQKAPGLLLGADHTAVVRTEPSSHRGETLFHISYAHVSIMPRIFSTVVFPLSGHVLSSESLDRQRISTAVSLSG
jgi:hypothetical protein